MSDLIDTTEMYLRTILELEEEGTPPLRARIAERLGQSGPTVSQTVARMERDGYLHVLDDRSIALTDMGRAAAVRVMRRHRLAELLLLDVIGLPWEEVHEEACRWEHVMSESVERRLAVLLGHPTRSPFGIPIPGLAALGESTPVSESERGATLAGATVGTEAPITVQVVSIAESVQHDGSVLAALGAAGALPGSTLIARRTAHGVEVTANQPNSGAPVLVPAWAAEAITVTT